MKDKNYFYSDGKEKFGPISLDELSTKELSESTLIWYEGLNDWKKLGEIYELKSILRIKAVPPPLPSEKKEEISKTEVSGTLEVKTKKEPNKVVEEFKPSRQGLKLFLIWVGFHFFALITSYSEVDIFSEGQETDNFWPFVEYQDCFKNFVKDNPYDYSSPSPTGKWNENCYFNGVFNDYDWSEFLVYVGGAVLIFFIGKLSSDDNLAENKNKELNEKSTVADNA